MDLIQSIDRRYCKREVEMKVLGLGLCRTGTDSLRKALKILGYNDVYHGYSAAFENPKDCELWIEAFHAKYNSRAPFGREEFDKLLGHCEAICDVPAVCFAEELIMAYPNAKVVLTNRDVDDWHSSVYSALHKNVFSYRAAVTSRLASLCFSSNRRTRPMFLKVWEHFFENQFESKGKQIYENHYASVRKMVPQERILEYRVQEGWEPLCKFLDVPVPQCPFPSGNTVSETSSRIKALVWHEMIKILQKLLWLGICTYVVLISVKGTPHLTTL